MRRLLDRGGSGPAARLNERLAAWAGVRIRPMFGRWGYFVGEHLFACFPLREKEHDLWVGLSPADQARALGTVGIRPHRRFAKRGWIEYTVESSADVDGALPWLRRAYEGARRGAAGDSGRSPRR
jgi:Family of unknown function (DUF5519)